jgi:pheromone shutdown protein TraB
MDPKTHVRIVGTSHIAAQSVRDVKRAFEDFTPDIVAVELDARRLKALEERAAGAEHVPVPLSLARDVGITGWLFLRLGGALQRRLGGIVNMDPGADMRAAVELAQERGMPVALVDRDILVTMRRLSGAFGAREKARMLWDVVSAPFRRQKVALRLDRVPSAQMIRMLMALLKERYPSLHHVLVVERNVHMCVRLDALARKTPGQRILLVVGAGHEEDLRVRLAGSGVFEIV